MKGVILHFNEAENEGVIKTDEDDNRYSFTKEDFKGQGNPKDGMKVDFVKKDDKATEIYKDVTASSSINTDNVANAIGDFQNSDVGQKVTALFTNGLHNAFGLIASVAMLICMFLPVVSINLMGMEKSAGLISVWYGKLAFLIIIVSGVLFYGGATRIYVKISSTIVAILFAIGCIDVFSSVGQVNELASAFKEKDIASSSFGLYLGILVLIGFLYLSYMYPYKKNEKTF